jgi:hypothetical protein
MARRRKKQKHQPPPPPPPPPCAEIPPPDFETQQELHEWMLHNTIGNKWDIPGYWDTREAYTRYGHWIDPEDNVEQLLGPSAEPPMVYEYVKVCLERYCAI